VLLGGRGDEGRTYDKLHLTCVEVGIKMSDEDDMLIPGKSLARYEVVIGEQIKGVPNVVGRFESLDDAKACLAHKKRLDKVCYIWDGRQKSKVG
jgi:hypothetical protein